MSNKTYDILVLVAQIILPALATLIVTLAKTWGLPYGAEISATIMAIDTFLGAILKYLQVKFNKTDNTESEAE